MAAMERARAGWPGDGRGRRLEYLPGLDGLRALAVVAVLLYHSGLPWIPGGFLGVEVFFVVSGYLITALLLAEWRATGRLDCPAFWLRRARRLLPALYVCIGLTLAAGVALIPSEVVGLRGDAAATAGYVTNWYLIFAHKPYFQAMGRPSLLQHLWSLAVEEQFYILWPLLLAGGLRLLRRRGMLCATLVGAAASAALMALLYQPHGDPSRIYYGTDTRAAGLLVGAALAMTLAWQQPNARQGRAWGLARDAAGAGALLGLGCACLRLDERQPFLFQGGLALVAVASAIVIVAAAQPQGYLGRMLGWAPLRWVGLRSYSIYLWHWPVVMLTRPRLDVPLDGPALLALRLLVTAVLAELSYRLVELPIRGGALGRAWRRWRSAVGPQRRRLGARWVAAAAAVLAFSATVGISVAAAQPPPVPSYLAVERIHVVPNTAAPPLQAAAAGEYRAVPGPQPEAVLDKDLFCCEPCRCAHQPTPRPTQPATPTPSPTPDAAPPGPARVYAIGDSVMLGAVGALQRALGDIEIDAAISRQFFAATNILRARRAAGLSSPVVVVHMGNNGGITRSEFDEMMQALAGVQRVVFLSLKVPREWEGPNNAIIAEGVARYPNAVLVDWRAASLERPDYFWEDGIHLRPEGAQAYAALVAAAVMSTP
ncbi:MAG TPA: acyltransferase family protein [Anaerolineae bacterium]|nr:acyltransferase family protein [Anaerolineae bacterium]HOR01436.1 acyltransferase family protein [Anaerolineae bacterium]HPL27151.1 acyltransferase family protein [Anaerolineae bacterium]